MSNEEKRPPGLQTTIHSGLKHGRDVTRLVRLLLPSSLESVDAIVSSLGIVGCHFSIIANSVIAPLEFEPQSQHHNAFQFYLHLHRLPVWYFS
jgi:hypothetical protein